MGGSAGPAHDAWEPHLLYRGGGQPDPVPVPLSPAGNLPEGTAPDPPDGQVDAVGRALPRAGKPGDRPRIFGAAVVLQQCHQPAAAQRRKRADGAERFPAAAGGIWAGCPSQRAGPH